MNDTALLLLANELWTILDVAGTPVTEAGLLAAVPQTPGVQALDVTGCAHCRILVCSTVSDLGTVVQVITVYLPADRVSFWGGTPLMTVIGGCSWPVQSLCLLSSHMQTAAGQAGGPMLSFFD